MRRSLVCVVLAGWSLGLAACGAVRGPSGPAPLARAFERWRASFFRWRTSWRMR